MHDLADPLVPNPLTTSQYHPVDIDRLSSSIMMGILTFDGNLLIIEPKQRKTVASKKISE